MLPKRDQVLYQEEYEKKYAGLEHTCYVRDWFKAQAKARGLECELFDGCVPDLLRKSRIACEYADGLKWTEIDFKEDIDRAKRFCGEL